MSIIDVTQPSPQRIIFAEGQWCLEVVRWQAIERDLFDPVCGYVPKAEALLLYLTELSSNPQVVEQARQIVSGPGDASVSYELDDGKWIQQKKFLSFSSLSAAVDASQTEDVRNHVREMEERLAFIERQLAGRVPGNDPNTSIVPIAHEEAARDITG